MLAAMWRDRTLIWLALLAFAVGTAVLGDLLMVVKIVRGGALFSDFTVFWTAARVDPSIIYDVSRLTHAQQWITRPQAGARPFAYPPTFIPWIKPFGLLPYWSAVAVWSVLGAGLFAAACLKLARLPVVAFALCSPMVFLVVTSGQATLLVAACLIAGLAYAPTRPFLAGALIGLAATIKPQAVMLAPVALLAGRQWRALAGVGLSGAAIGISCLAIQGPRLWLDWIAAASDFLNITRRLGFLDIGVTPLSLASTLHLPAWATGVTVAAGAALGLSSVWVVFRATPDWAPRLAALVAGCLLCTPYAFDYELAALQPAAAAMLLDRKGSRISWTVGALAFTAGAGPFSVIAIAVSLLWRYWAEGPQGGPERQDSSVDAPTTTASGS